jgi:hypothetical protein
MALLFCAQGAQAAPIANADFGTLSPGFTGTELFSTNDNREVAWFSFNLSSAANVSVDTFCRTDDTAPPFSDVLDSIIALYDGSGSLIIDTNGADQNNDCTVTDFTSCQSFASLAPLTAGLYLIGVTESGSNRQFKNNWILENGTDQWVADIKVNIGVSAVPVPAAIWLFGTALIGFVGMSRRTSVKT